MSIKFDDLISVSLFHEHFLLREKEFKWEREEEQIS